MTSTGSATSLHKRTRETHSLIDVLPRDLTNTDSVRAGKNRGMPVITPVEQVSGPRHVRSEGDNHDRLPASGSGQLIDLGDLTLGRRRVRCETRNRVLRGIGTVFAQRLHTSIGSVGIREHQIFGQAPVGELDAVLVPAQAGTTKHHNCISRFRCTRARCDIYRIAGQTGHEDHDQYTDTNTRRPTSRGELAHLGPRHTAIPTAKHTAVHPHKAGADRDR